MPNINIPCPDCSTSIPADSMKLLQGEQFSCPKCGLKVGMSEQPKEAEKTVAAPKPNGPSINCPDCNAGIALDTKDLLAGKQMTCPNCGLKVGMAKESNRDIKNAMEAFEKIKNKGDRG